MIYPTQVINRHKACAELLASDRCVDITRDTKWGNRFSHLARSRAQWLARTREEAIAKYEAWLIGQPELMRELPSLKGKILVCVCVPQACHGETLARFAESYPTITLAGGVYVFFDEAGYVTGSGVAVPYKH